MTIPTPFLHRLYLGGCLLLVTTPLLLYFWLAIQGVPCEGTVRVCAGDDYQAGRALSQSTAIMSLVNVSTRRGFLGLEWVVAVEQAQAGAEP